MSLTEFRKEYERKLKTPEELVDMMEDGTELFCDSCVSLPRAVSDAMKAKALAGEIHRIKVHHVLDMYPAAWYDPEIADAIDAVSWFSGKSARNAVNQGHSDIMPTRYVDMARNLKEYGKINSICVTVAPMDDEGYFSTGATAAIAVDVMDQVENIYLEVNENMPRGTSGNKFHISHVTALCESHMEMPIVPPAPIDEISSKIGSHIAAEIPDGATIQLGIGAIPEAVASSLKGHKNLGIHTELLTDGMVDLVECGAVTNTLKPIHTGKTISTIAFGTRKLYDFINNNPDVEMLPVSHVNDPNIISLHPKFMSVNSALEVDFFGQVCAESIGTKHVSGSGGQWEYVHGAVRSEGGKSFIAFTSTAMDGTVSRIKPILTPGAVVTTGKNDVDRIVTEYGIAELRGRTLAERTRALIAIAHPKFRDELTKAAKERNILI